MTDRQVRISWLLVAILTGTATVGRAQTGGAIRFTDVTGVAGVALEGLTTVLRVAIRWPSGLVQVLENLEVDQILTVVEGP